MGRGPDIPGTLIHHLPPLAAGKDGRELLVLAMEEASRLSAPPFSSQICCSSPHTAPASLLQLSAPTQQMGQGSQPALALTKTCWIAAPSITHPSGADGSQQHQACPLACPHQILLHKHLGTAGGTEGTPGWSRAPCSFSQAVTSLTAPSTGASGTSLPTCCHSTAQLCTASSWEELPDPMWCTTHHGTHTLLYSLNATGHLFYQPHNSRTLKCV